MMSNDTIWLIVPAARVQPNIGPPSFNHLLNLLTMQCYGTMTIF